jgi:hypothetical protein
VSKARLIFLLSLILASGCADKAVEQPVSIAPSKQCVTVETSKTTEDHPEWIERIADMSDELISARCSDDAQAAMHLRGWNRGAIAIQDVESYKACLVDHISDSLELDYSLR